MRADKDIAAATAELLLPHVPKDRRVFLAAELVRLGEERTELAGSIDYLSVRVQQLSANVRDLERQNPYAL